MSATELLEDDGAGDFTGLCRRSQLEDVEVFLPLLPKLLEDRFPVVLLDEDENSK